jgi:HD-like signal output (HDOD) protein
VQQLSGQEMPLFAHSAKMLQDFAGKSDAGVNELIQIVLRDPVLTAKLMRVANSAYYNTSGAAVGSVSRAVMVLGMDTVRQLFLAMSLVDSLVQDGPLQERVNQELARALHAAFQARALAQLNRDAAIEDVFVSAMLVNLGSLAFWCYGGSLAQELDAILRKGSTDTAQVQKDIIGFRLTLLSAALAQEWKLPQLLTQALRGMGSSDARIQYIHFGWQVALATELGWYTKGARALGEKFATEQRLSLREVGIFFHGNTIAAATMAKEIGASHAAERIPVMQLPPFEGDAAPSIFDLPPPAGRFPQENADLRLKALRQLAALTLSSEFSIGKALQVVAEGLRDGCGMDRVAIAMADKEGMMLPRAVVGEQILQLEQEFRWDTRLRSPNAFNRLLEEPSLLLVRPDQPGWRPLLLPSQLSSLIQGHAFVAFPLTLLGRSMGLWYADRVPSGRPLDETAGSILQTFLVQAAALLENGLKQSTAIRANSTAALAPEVPPTVQDL